MRPPGALELLEAASRRRALLAGGLTAAAVALGLPTVAPTADPGVRVVAAARDLLPGEPLAEQDLVEVEVPRDVVPSGAVTDAPAVVGRLVAGPVRRGEPLTDVRLLGASLVPAGGLVAAPVRVADPATGALVRPGDRVDVLAAAPEGGPLASVVAADVGVLAVPALADDTGEGALLVLAASPTTAARLAAAAVTGRLSVAVLGR